MALVAYDNSDSSEFEDEEENSTKTNIESFGKYSLFYILIMSPIFLLIHLINLLIITGSVVKTEVTSDNSNTPTASSDIFKSLPPTRQKIQPIEEDDDEFLRKKATDVKQKARIMVPSLNDVCFIFFFLKGLEFVT